MKPPSAGISVNVYLCAMTRTSTFQWVTSQLKRLCINLLTSLIVLWGWLRRRSHLVRLAYKIPGPPCLPLVGGALNVRPEREAMFKYLEKIWNTYGPVYGGYLGPIYIVNTGCQEDQEKVLSENEHLEKGIMYNFTLKAWLGEGLLLSSGEKWRRRRKALTPTFHFRILDQFVPVFLNCGDEFVQQLRTRAGGAAFDVWPLVKLLTLDVVCETIMGVKMNAQTNSNSEYVNAVRDISSIIYDKAMRPWLYPQFIFRRSALGRRYKQCLEILHGTTDAVIQERKAELQMLSGGERLLDVDELGRRRRVAFLDLLLLTARDGSLSDADIREEVDTFMFEGHDTTAAAISFAIFLLSRHEDVQNKILQELESIFTSDEPLHPTIQQLSELKYLEMVIKESMRIYPPVPAVARELTSDLQLKSRPLTVPEGTTLFLNFYIMHRNPEVYPNPETFDPERFRQEESSKRHPFSYLPFSAGSRNCIGQRFAMLEMKSLLAKLIWNFRILPESDFKPILVWELILRSKNGVLVKFEERHR